MSKQQVLFSDRSLEQLAGENILKDAKTAIIELIANAWDAGASRVDIEWPEHATGKPFSIRDNGCGLSRVEFAGRWMQVGYNRQEEQGPLVAFPTDMGSPAKRKAFGRNGLGRFAAFRFSCPYYVCTAKDGETQSYKVAKSPTNLLDVEEIPDDHSIGDHGTIVYAKHADPPALSVNDVKTEIGMRFLTDPNFKVLVNGGEVSFLDVPDINKQTLKTFIDDQEINITAIDIHGADKTTYQHGVAWHVNGRLVGECSWKGPNAAYVVDGRRTAAKRFTFIVKADCLDQDGFILPDWSGFNQEKENVERVFDAVHDEIKTFILSHSKKERDETFQKIREASKTTLQHLGLEDLEIWDDFVKTIQIECPSLGDNELMQIAKILANLELSKSKYSLLEKLSSYDSDNLDDLNNILGEWTLRMAKAVLDKIRERLLIISELENKTQNKSTDEVKELQPLFEKSLWIFGPEFETIEYTSNKGMTKVIQELFGSSQSGSRKRPDFAILPDGSCNLYTLPKYDYENGGMEIGTEKLVILELKKPDVPIRWEEKTQPQRYIDELDERGLIEPGTKIVSFVLGKSISRGVGGASTNQDKRITIHAMTYRTAINNAHARLMNLYEKVQNAPFLDDDGKKEVQQFLHRGDQARAQSEINI